MRRSGDPNGPDADADRAAGGPGKYPGVVLFSEIFQITDVLAACFYATDIHSHSMGKGKKRPAAVVGRPVREVAYRI